MTKKTNGQTTKLRGEKDKPGDKLDSQGEDKIRADGSSIGFESERTNRTVGPTRIFTREEREAFGKILEQLQELQREHIKYVESHGDRLIQRLKENHEHKSTVLGKMSALEEEVVRILGGELEHSAVPNTEEE